jgi:hypothetical protein
VAIKIKDLATINSLSERLSGVKKDLDRLKYATLDEDTLVTSLVLDKGPINNYRRNDIAGILSYAPKISEYTEMLRFRQVRLEEDLTKLGIEL